MLRLRSQRFVRGHWKPTRHFWSAQMLFQRSRRSRRQKELHRMRQRLRRMYQSPEAMHGRSGVTPLGPSRPRGRHRRHACNARIAVGRERVPRTGALHGQAALAHVYLFGGILSDASDPEFASDGTGSLAVGNHSLARTDQHTGWMCLAVIPGSAQGEGHFLFRGRGGNAWLCYAWPARSELQRHSQAQHLRAWPCGSGSNDS
mmetsp:Transcript_100819/g.268004  ORF Transcript_100819/g.268004 Transcript_100819/m.268004 type:complete len:203 (-) Transcript_100819:28-636(-)